MVIGQNQLQVTPINMFNKSRLAAIDQIASKLCVGTLHEERAEQRRGKQGQRWAGHIRAIQQRVKH